MFRCLPMTILPLVAPVALALLTALPVQAAPPLTTALPVKAERVARDCVIKGNISTRGERIYHMPGDKYYTRTRISPAEGERWFCTEAEARAAGWRRSRV